jgi:cytosine/adenosine deaminase-related metal-dependent hydrolase
MAIKKFSADKIFTGTQLLENKVLVTTELGTIVDLVEKTDAGDDVQNYQGWLCPGFINAHCHIELSHMQGVSPALSGMVPFLLKVMFERQADDRIKQKAINEAIMQMQQNGIVGIGDICNTVDSIAAKKTFPSIYFHNFVEVTGFVPTGAAMRFEQALSVAAEFCYYSNSSQTTIVPHSPYSVSEKLFDLVAKQNPNVISIHNQESAAEDDFIRNKSGDVLQLFKAIGANIDFFEPKNTSSLQYTIPLFPKNAQVILVHNCHTKEDDIEALENDVNISNNKYFFCLCPQANAYIGNPLPNVSVLQKSNFPICIGTDSLASNYQLSILKELQMLQLHYPFLKTKDLLQWGTYNGAKALKSDQQLGTFEKGKKPGILLLENITENNIAKATVKNLTL